MKKYDLKLAGSIALVALVLIVAVCVASAQSTDPKIANTYGAGIDTAPERTSFKTALALENVDNTSDANKPVSTATQTALDLKAPLASPTFTGIALLPATTSIGNVSSTEIGYLDNVSSAIQDQLNAKALTAHAHVSADITNASTGGNGNSDSGKLVKFGEGGTLSGGSIGGEFNGIYGASGLGYGLIGESYSGIGLRASTVTGDYHARFGGSTGDNRSFVARVLGAYGWHRGAYTLQVSATDTLTANRHPRFPDKDGTIALTSDITATNSTVTPAGNIAATNVQSALEELDAEKASLAGDNTLSGVNAFSSTTRPTSSGTGTPASNSLVTLADTDLRYVGNNVSKITFDTSVLALWTTVTSGTGASAYVTGYGIGLNNTGIGSVTTRPARVSGSVWSLGNFPGGGTGGIDFSKRFNVESTIFTTYTYNAAVQDWAIVISVQTTTAGIALMTPNTGQNYIALCCIAGNLTLQVSNATTKTTSSTLGTHLSGPFNKLYRIENVGGGSVNLYIDNALAGSITGGPIGQLPTNNGLIHFLSDSSAAAANILFSNPTVSWSR